MPPPPRVRLSGTDEIGRLLARYHPPRRPNITAEDFRGSRGKWGRSTKIDRILGRFIEQAEGRHADVVLVSDHGFQRGEDRPVVSDLKDDATASLWHAPEGLR